MKFDDFAFLNSKGSASVAIAGDSTKEAAPAAQAKESEAVTQAATAAETSGSAAATAAATAAKTSEPAATAAATAAAKRPMNWGFISIIAIAALVACSCAVWLCMKLAFAGSADERVVVITDGDGQTQRIPITENGTYTIESSLGKNVVVISYGSVYMAEADCPGHDCIEQGAIDTAGEIIVCLPHKLIVNIEGGESSEIDSVAS